MAEPHDFPVAPAPPVSDTEGPAGPAYRPLAVSAILGLSLASLFAVFLVGCWAVAWLRGTPLLLPCGILGLPVLAFVLSAVGWLQVQRSEGTRAGANLAVSGMVLSGLFGLMYGAYLMASYFALGQEAGNFATRYLELIREGRLDEAFRLTLPSDTRRALPTEGEALHSELEARFDAPSRSSGLRGIFGRAALTRIINHSGTREGGTETHITPRGMKSWTFKDGAYTVQLLYTIDTPERTVEAQVSLRSTESRSHKGGREWTIMAQEPDSAVTAELEVKPLGQRIKELQSSSANFIGDWTRKLDRGEVEAAFLETQEPEQRSRLRVDYGARLAAVGMAEGGGLADLGPLVDPDLARQAFLPGYAGFARGDLVRSDPSIFWAEGDFRQKLPEAVRGGFAHGGSSVARAILPDTPPIVLWNSDGDRVRFRHDFRLVMAGALAQGALIVEADARCLEPSGPAPQWRLARMDLYTAHDLPPGGPGPR